MARPKGSKNKTGATAKDNILAVFNRLGGTSQMAQWAKDNLTEFYKLYGRLIPQQVSAEVTHTVRTIDEDKLSEAINRALSGASQPTVQ